MARLIARGAAGLALACLVAGCVSTSSRPQAPVSKTEAAKYNMELGISYLRQGDYKGAQAKLERALQDDSSLSTAYSALGLVYEKLGDPAGAEKNYRRAVSMDSSSPDNLNALAVFLCLQKKETDEALRYFDKALAIPLSKAEFNQAMVYTNAGVCAKREDLVRAENYLRSALAADPGFRLALVQLADVALLRQNYLQSRAFLERYLAAGPASADALWIGVRVEKALGEPTASKGYADRLKKDFPASVETGLLLESERNAG